MDWIGHRNPAHAGMFAARGMRTVLARERDPDRHTRVVQDIVRALSEEPSDVIEGGRNVARRFISPVSSLTSFVTDSSNEVRGSL